MRTCRTVARVGARAGTSSWRSFWFRTGDGRELRFFKAGADHWQPQYPVVAAIDNDRDSGWAIGPSQGGANRNRTGWFVLPRPLEVDANEALVFSLRHQTGERPRNIGRLRLAISAEPWVDAPSADELAGLVAMPERGPAQKKRIDEAFLRSDPVLGPVFAELERVTGERDTVNNEVASTMVLQELEAPRPAHVQQRGDFLQPGEPVECDVPAALPGFDDSRTPRTRLDLARWLVRPDNPLTPRVRVNRIWMRLFGKGLVENGERLRHAGFLADAPRVARLARGGAPSAGLVHETNAAADRQLGHLPPAVAGAPARRGSRPAEIDSCGDRTACASRARWSAIWPSRRAGCSPARSAAPASIRRSPKGVYAFTQRKKNWRTSTGEDRYRRGMYTFFFRTAPYPMLTTFDAPKFNQTCTHRDRSNTPLQSLTAANDPTMVEAAQALARRVLVEGGPDATSRERLARMFRICLVRPPTESEWSFLAQFHEEQRRHFDGLPEAARAIAPGGEARSQGAAALVAVARVVLNLDEFITRE